MQHKIVQTKVTDTTIEFTLDNGVTVLISSNPEYLHLSFSGADIPMKVGPYHHAPYNLSAVVSNILDVSYKPMER